MRPVDFKEKTRDMGAPDGMPDVQSLAVNISPVDPENPDLNGVYYFLSCWQFESDQEKEEFIKTGKLWVGVVGTGLQPMSFTAESPFQTKSNQNG